MVLLAVRTALVALIAFMPTPPNGALGSLDYTKEERRKLAVKSREAPPTFGSSERQKLIDEIHDYMLSKAPPVPQSLKQASEEHPTETEAEGQGSETAGGDRVDEAPQEAAENVNVNVNPQVVHREDRQVRAGVVSRHQQQQQRRAPRAQAPADDRLLTWAAVGLTVAIVFLLLKKLMKSSGYGAIFMSES